MKIQLKAMSAMSMVDTKLTHQVNDFLDGFGAHKACTGMSVGVKGSPKDMKVPSQLILSTESNLHGQCQVLAD